MDTLLARATAEQRRDLFVATGERMGISAQLVEKDFWVCWMLRRLFTLPELAGHLTFKGGTSLSKAFGLIERFSEDIDLIIERHWLGVSDEPTGGNSQWIKKIKRACRYKLRDVLIPKLEQEIAKRLAGEPFKQDLQDVFHKPHDSRFLHPVNPFLAVFSGQWVATSPEPEGFKER